MTAFEKTASISMLANALSLHLTDAELALLASLLVQLGDTLATIAAERALREAQTHTT